MPTIVAYAEVAVLIRLLLTVYAAAFNAAAFFVSLLLKSVKHEMDDRIDAQHELQIASRLAVDSQFALLYENADRLI